MVSIQIWLKTPKGEGEQPRVCTRQPYAVMSHFLDFRSQAIQRVALIPNIEQAIGNVYLLLG
jgi:hypothetical protein